MSFDIQVFHHALSDFDTFSVDKRWYSLNYGQNITVTGWINLSLSEGSHVLNFYANNTIGSINDTERVYFTVNNTFGYNVSYSQYSGNTTNFNSFSESDFHNITNFTLERSIFGKMRFLENINMSYPDVNLDLFTEIRSNYIFINSSSLSFFLVTI